ncbi:MAG: hypothetical protein OFPII_15180 [Osedax symbiont Rs1]|nr:MAG: hypothetical protein OFPII_15180 [Osedax symbiont Rs1]
MKQTINLLPNKPKTVRNWLAFNNLLSILAITLVSSLSLSAYFWWQANSLQTNLQAQQLANTNATREIINLTTRLAQQDAPTPLTVQVEQLTQQIAAMQQMLDLSTEYSFVEQSGFLQMFDKLQSSIPVNSQLESFKATAGQQFTYIRGSTTHAATVPKLLDNLRVQNLLHRQNIANLKIQRATEHYRFEILTSHQEARQ